MSGRRITRNVNRRQFLATSATGAAGLALARQPANASEGKTPAVSFGLVTDVHYADIPAAGERHYRDSATKLGEAVRTFNRRKVDFIRRTGRLFATPARARPTILTISARSARFSRNSRARDITYWVIIASPS